MNGLSRASENLEKKTKIAALLIAGEKPVDICRQLDVTASMVTRVKQSLSPDVLARMQQEKFMRIQDQITDHLEETLDTMSYILQQFRDPEWRNKQDAQHLASAYGTFSDKSVRIIEATEAANIARENAARLRGAEE